MNISKYITVYCGSRLALLPVLRLLDVPDVPDVPCYIKQFNKDIFILGTCNGNYDFFLFFKTYNIVI